MKTKILFFTVLTAAFISCLSFAQESSDLTVDEIQICTSVEDRTPVGADTSFSSDVETLYCFTKIKNSGERTTVAHSWYYNEKEVSRVDLNVGTPSWRTWSLKTIPPSYKGEWKVYVLASDGSILASKSFEIK